MPIKSRGLLIEDSAAQAQLVAASLSQYGIDVKVAYDGPEGLQAAIEQEPDFIVLDINLPTMNGFQICRRLKRDAQTRQIPVIMLTSESDSASTLEGLDCGADDFIPKDAFAVEILLSTLKALDLY